MKIEYEGEPDGDPIRIVLRMWDRAEEGWADRRQIGNLVPPAPKALVFVNDEPHTVHSLRFYSYPGNTSLDWAEVYLG